ncbi:PLDc N-terminal domain-containing protein [Microbacterium capsulatum]|uniref:PLDc N-terminal domain-containing protein n=1 Tax=Microbacterium capsulatum TaxID=3041921 RepID=A0ABU0XID8_9MICO|nr:PLDc N-terminal domain-containing protein [Microbacterium sp. ASV81]MDQ4214866.1 PLDc N-terminal domain-containing protein [Microbacterium sp. ASV81]
MNPLIPSDPDLVLAAITLVAMAFTAVAFISLMLTKAMRPLAFLLWVVLVFALPVAGPTAWFAARPRYRAPDRSSRTRPTV